MNFTRDELVARLVKAGELEARKYGKRTLILRDDLLRFLTSLPTVGTEATR